VIVSKSALDLAWSSRQAKVVMKYGRWTHQIGALSKGIRLNEAPRSKLTGYRSSQPP